MSRTHRDGGFGGAWERHERKYSSRRERMLEREYCNRAKVDQDAPLSYDVEKREPMWGKGWTGYWRPMRRWLASRVGQQWNQVYSDLIAKLKTFSSTKDELSIRHYITNLVEVTPDPRYGGSDYSYFIYDFYVDDTGILQRKKHLSKHRTKLPKCDMNKIAAWLDGRSVGKVGDKFYWFVHTTGTKKYGGRRHNKIVTMWTKGYYSRGFEYKTQYNEPIHELRDGKYVVVGNKMVWHDVGSPTKQDKKLSPTDMEFWNKIPEHVKKMIMELTPVYTGERYSDRYGYYGYYF